MNNTMTTTKTRRYAALLAAAFLVSVLVGITKESYAQPCKMCLQAIRVIGPCQCQRDPDTCVGCHIWGLVNNCQSCITEITVESKDGIAFRSCCSAVDSAAVGWWRATQIDSTTVQYNAYPGTCLSDSVGHNMIQLTSCGLSTGDVVYVGLVPI